MTSCSSLCSAIGINVNILQVIPVILLSLEKGYPCQLKLPYRSVHLSLSILYNRARAYFFSFIWLTRAKHKQERCPPFFLTFHSSAIAHSPFYFRTSMQISPRWPFFFTVLMFQSVASWCKRKTMVMGKKKECGFPHPVFSRSRIGFCTTTNHYFSISFTSDFFLYSPGLNGIESYKARPSSRNPIQILRKEVQYFLCL